MKSINAPFLIFFLSALSRLFTASLAEPVQYCRFGHQDGEVDFCMGVTMHHNYSADAYDLYLTMSVTRSSALGWTAIGTGPAMAGSLMFIVYGDPSSGQGPVLSIRAVDGHHQPHIVEPKDMGGADLLVLQAAWMSAEHNPEAGSVAGVHEAKFAAVCYACSRFPGSPISVATSSQPWIWAWNADQDMTTEIATSSPDGAHLNMHAHQAGNGGWGVFYVDMARSASEEPRLPSLPPLRPGVATLGSSDGPIGAAGLVASLRTARPLVAAHGISMALAFLVLTPLGVVAVRSGRPNAVRYHLVLQAMAMALVSVGAACGVAMSRGEAFTTAHQWAGTAIVIAGVVLQPLLGWRHHVAFLRIRRRTWVSHVHIWLGRLTITGGWINILSGVFLAGHGREGVAIVAGLVVIEAFAVVLWVCVANIRSKRKATKQDDSGDERAALRSNGVEEYFALGESEDDEKDHVDDESGESKGSLIEKPRKSMAGKRNIDT